MVKDRKEGAERQTAIRLAMLDNGYTPLANLDKSCRLTGWPSVVVTPKLVAEWGQSLRWQATGLRLENGLCAVDLDIDDPNVIAALHDWAAENWPRDLYDNLLIRHGRGSKQLWLLRVDEPFHQIVSAAFAGPGVDPAATHSFDIHRIEIFGGGSSRQFGVYGAHTLGEDGLPALEYRWEDPGGPAAVALVALPVATKADLHALCDAATAIMDEAGWARVPSFVEGEHEYTVVYDLTDDMTFHCSDGQVRSLAQLLSYAEHGRDPRCSAYPWLEGDPGRNRRRCLISLHEGVVQIWDTAEWTAHRPVYAETAAVLDTALSRMSDLLNERALTDPVLREELDREFADDPEPLPDVSERLGAALRERALLDPGLAAILDDAEAAGANTERLRERVGYLLENYAFITDRPTSVAPIFGQETHCMTFATARMLETPHGLTYRTARGAVKRVNPFELWLASPERVTVAAYRFAPHLPPGLHYDEGSGEWWINCFRPLPDWSRYLPTSQARYDQYARLFDDYMTHLLASADEKDYVLDWLAYNYQNPGHRTVTLLMVAQNTFGVGRGLLTKLLRDLMGAAYVGDATAAQFASTTGQAQYTDWLARKLIVAVDEMFVASGFGSEDRAAHVAAYNRLREIVEPGTTPVMRHIIRKTLPNYDEYLTASMLLYTNHGAALRLASNDRRVTVVQNRLLPLIQNETLFARIGKVFAEGEQTNYDREYVAVVADVLARRDLSRFSPVAPVRFAAFTRMLEAAKPPLELLVEDIVEARFPSRTFVTANELIDAVRAAYLRTGETPPPWTRSALDDAMREMGWRAVNGGARLKVLDAQTGKQTKWKVFMRVGEDMKAAEDLEAALLAAPIAERGVMLAK